MVAVSRTMNPRVSRCEPGGVEVGTRATNLVALSATFESSE